MSRNRELVLTIGELEEPLGGASGHVEEHRVGQGFVGGAEPFGEQPHHHPEQFGPRPAAPSRIGS